MGGRGPARGGECARWASLHGRLLLILPAPQPQGGPWSSNPGPERGRASLQTSVKERKGSRCWARGSCPSRRAPDSARQAMAGCGAGHLQAEGRQGRRRPLPPPPPPPPQSARWRWDTWRTRHLSGTGPCGLGDPRRG